MDRSRSPGRVRPSAVILALRPLPRRHPARYTPAMPVFDSLHQNAFTVLTLIAAPAVLTNASSVLALGTSNRFARAVDRQRELSRLLDDGLATDADGEADLRLRQLRRTAVRGQLLLRALTSFYVSLASFAAAALASLLGALVDLRSAGLGTVAGVAAMTIGLTGVGGLVFGCVLLVRETRVALEGLKEEAAFTQQRVAARAGVRSGGAAG